MGEINLSKAVRSNLLSLQSTAASMAQTQERLATGLKVNSALDNPSNFFTASALNSRASDMSNLLDAMSSGIKTIEAADNGLSSITKTVESMQSTLRQARQDKSFQAQSFTLPTGTPTGSEQLTLSGGALGASKSIDLTTGGGGGGTSAMVSVAAADFSPIHLTPISYIMPAMADVSTISPSTFANGDTLDITVTLDGSPNTVSIGRSDVEAAGNGDNVIGDGYELTEILNSKFDTAGINARAASPSGHLVVFNNNLPRSTSSTIGLSETAHDQGGAGTVTTLGLAGGAFNPGILNASGYDNPLLTIQIDGGAPRSIVITGDSGTDGDTDITSLSEYADLINTAYGSTVATINSSTGAMEIKSPTTGAGSKVKITGTFNGSGELGGLQDTTASGNAGSPTAYKTTDELVQEINTDTSINGSVRASNDNGKLRIENLSTADLSASGNITGGTIGGNDVRANLVKQFNDLRDQLDKFSDDASFNGINLLRGDKLKLTFNETGTSTIEIQARDADGEETAIDDRSLGIDEALNGDFDSDDDIDARLDTLSDVLGTLRSQSSAFGSNLSIVENRTDFTKSMINTLETGADGLTLADTNQEAASLLALQTRQQLSSTALSMASQQDQAVLRLF